MNKQFFVDQLQEELNSLESCGITGIASMKRIMADLTESEFFLLETTIIYNKQFELVFKMKEQVIEFRTTYSNQIITREYMNDMMRVDQSKGVIGSLVKSIIQFSNIEG